MQSDVAAKEAALVTTRGHSIQSQLCYDTGDSGENVSSPLQETLHHFVVFLDTMDRTEVSLYVIDAGTIFPFSFFSFNCCLWPT